MSSERDADGIDASGGVFAGFLQKQKPIIVAASMAANTGSTIARITPIFLLFLPVNSIEHT